MSDAPGNAFETPSPDPDDLVTCWRCGGSVSSSEPRCPRCAAPLSEVTVRPPSPPVRLAPTATPLVRMMLVYAILLATSLIYGMVLQAQALFGAPGNEPSVRELLTSIAVVEGIDTVVVFAALTWVGLRRHRPVMPIQRRFGAWIAFPPLLAGVLALNIAYHQFLVNVVGVPVLENRFLAEPDLLFLGFVLICVQPAVIEELFFRYLALDSLQQVLRPWTAVLISSLMFGLAHIATPLSIPILLVLGILLGYARLASGGLLLPMALHLTHNLAVLTYEYVLLNG